MTVVKQTILEKIKNRTARVCVAGLGYVGLPFAVEKGKMGFHVVGVDRKQERVDMVNRGINFISDVKDDELKELVDKGLLSAVLSFEDAGDIDVLVIAVPTPLTKNLTPDLQYVENVTRLFAPFVRPGQLISLESTTYPGTTEEIMLPILESSGLKAEKDFFVAHSPERVDPGNQRYTTKNTNKVVGGVGPESLDVAYAFYSQTIDHVVPVSSAKAAELVKVFENTFRAVNIALVNELALLCDRMELNVWEVLDAAFTKPFGIMPFYPGPGVGGHCIPLDPHYLEWKAKELNFSTHFIALAGEINRMMPEFVRLKAWRVLNSFGVAPSQAKILVMGVAYKKDLDDCRESPAINILEMLVKDGAQVVYHDPFVSAFSQNGISMQSQPLTQELIERQHLVMILTDHSNVDYTFLATHAAHILDTRNATRKVTVNRERITLL
ncbi:MAG: nucleotide sugar dehydrogenase [Acidobacteria bacterium]|nr:nucleotide sugar dehydrogenase [Acidobacteriota bacterium]